MRSVAMAFLAILVTAIIMIYVAGTDSTVVEVAANLAVAYWTIKLAGKRNPPEEATR
jgi:hypothetical protein